MQCSGAVGDASKLFHTYLKPKTCGVELGWEIFNRKFMMRILNISWLKAQMQPIRTISVICTEF